MDETNFLIRGKLLLLQNELGKERIKLDCDISEYLISGLGGLAKAFYIATTTAELMRVVRICKELDIDFLIIGSGSKVALSKSGFLGLVIKNRSDNVKVLAVKGKISKGGLGVEEVMVEADSGISLKRLAEFAALRKLSGLEITYDQLGTLGGSLFLNSTLRDRACQIKILTEDTTIKTKLPHQLKKDDLVLSAILKLKSKAGE